MATSSTPQRTRGEPTNVAMTRASNDPGTSLPNRLPPTISLLARVFVDDPVVTYFLSDLTPIRRRDYLPQYFGAVMDAARRNDAVFVEANNYGCAAVLMPPGKRVDNPFTVLQSGLVGTIWNAGWASGRRMIWEYAPQADAMKRAHLRDAATGKPLARYHYLFVVGTEVASRGQGLASRIIEAQQQVAARDGLPIWLEASTGNSRRVYERCGFETVGEIVLGKGTHGIDGAWQTGGPGVVVFPMMWWPEGKRG